MKFTSSFLILILLPFLMKENSFAQKRELTKKSNQAIQIEWEGKKATRFNDLELIHYLSFKNCSYNSENLPVFSLKFDLVSDVDFNVELYNVVTESFNSDQLSGVKGLTGLSSEFTVQSKVLYNKGMPLGTFSVIPIRKRGSGFEKLVSFNYSITYSSARKSRAATRIYAENSVLASGSWYKIGVVNDGIYKLSYSYLDSLGIKSGVNTANIRIFGNGGGMLPETNSVYRPDDLVENAIHVQDNNGILDSSDFVLFYGEGPHKWKYDSLAGTFKHQLNIYSDTTYYFITADGGSGPSKRIVSVPSLTQNSTSVITSFDDYVYFEKENTNLIRSGRVWFGEKFDIVTSYNFNLVFPNIDASNPVCIITDYAARTTSSGSHFNINFQAQERKISVPGMSPNEFESLTSRYAIPAQDKFCFTPTSSGINLTYAFNKGNATSVAWLNYIEVISRRHLRMHGQQMKFRDASSVAEGSISEFSLSASSLNTIIWDITNPLNVKKQEYILNGANTVFRTSTDTLKEFIAFNGGYLRPITSFKINNQNLHASSPADYIIISHPRFNSEALRLAELHKKRHGYKVLVVSPQEIYNEFSSGSQDITAIKDFVKMLYDKKYNPQYLLLLGDASYSYKNKSSNSNFVPAFQSSSSLDPISSYVSDDYFGLLDDAEGSDPRELLDIGIGRFPVQTLAEAKALVDKTEIYSSAFNPAQLNPNNCTSIFSPSPFGDWRNKVVFIADDEDNNLHVVDAERVASMISNNADKYNIDKIYLDAYKQESSPGGARYPEVQKAINQAVERGALIVNYVGHGGEVGWTAERVLEVADVKSWKNKPRLPLFVTATCEFSRFDDPARVSAGEYVILNPNGGAIALLTTTRVVFANQNAMLNQSFIRNSILADTSLTFGTLTKETKNDVAPSVGINQRNFSLLGDPGLKMAYPRYNIKTTEINGTVIGTSNDSIKISGLSKVTVKGIVTDSLGNKITSYNGIIFPTVLDKSQKISTLGNDATSQVMKFDLQKNSLYKGKASVVNGEFSFSFIVPKDVSYKIEKGKLSYYAAGELDDASGSFEEFYIEGAKGDAIADNIGPNIDLFMNDKKFVYGGVTDQNPVILAYVTDSSGVNTVGNGIGHDITAIIDENTSQSITLNDFYEADLNSYQSGMIRYPLKDVAEGPHKLKLKVWDVHNNSSETITEFVVASSASIALKHVLNYPNPFTTSTAFYFEHNQPCNLIDVQILIFTISGKIVKTIDRKIKCEGYRSDGIHWDGLDEYGDKIGKGVYVYRLKVMAPNGTFADKFEKLVILK